MSSDKPQKLDMDIIEMVQAARMRNDDTAKPSEISAVYWIEARAPQQNPTPRAGALVIGTTLDKVDELWAKVKAATEAGTLGYKAKVSTSPGRDQGSNDARLIHVRVADGDELARLEQIRATLRDLGASGELPFVPDHP